MSSPRRSDPRLVRAAACALAFGAALAPWTSAAGQEQADPQASSIRMLQRAAAPADQTDLELVSALRQVRDPDLKPFFLLLAQSKDWRLQVQGVLALGEINSSGHIDPWMLMQLEAPTQERALAASLDRGLISAEQIPQLLTIETLSPLARLLLLAEQSLLKQSPDLHELQALAKSSHANIAGLAAALLMHAGQPAALDALTAGLDQRPAEQTEQLGWLMQVIREYEIQGCAPWVKQILDRPNLDGDVALEGVLALLTLGDPDAVEHWSRRVAQAVSYQDRVRCGMLLLSRAVHVPASAFDQLAPSDDEILLQGVVRAGKAIASGSDPAASAIELVGVDHPRTWNWAMEFASQLDDAHAVRIYDYVLTRSEAQADRPDGPLGLIAEAASRLFEIEPQRVLARLSAVPDDSPAQEALLLGLFQSTSKSVGDAAAALPRIGAGRADCLALLLMAKHATSLAADDLRQLGLIASGGGRVTPGLQVQAAWLYLKHSEATEQALAEVFPAN